MSKAIGSFCQSTPKVCKQAKVEGSIGTPKETEQTIATKNQEDKELRQECVAVSDNVSDSLNTIMTGEHKNVEDPLCKLFWQEQAKILKTSKRKWHPMMIKCTRRVHCYRSLRETGVIAFPGESALRDHAKAVDPQHGTARFQS